MIKRNQKGISMVSLVITIIVILILAAVAFIGSRESVKRAGLSKYVAAIGDLQEIMTTEYTNLSGTLAANRESFREKEIYYMVATGEKLDDVSRIMKSGTVSELTTRLGLQTGILKGAEYYEITDETRINAMKKAKQYNDEQSYYITDKGVVFALPGYDMTEDENNKWYINGEMYYAGIDPKYDSNITKADGSALTVESLGIKVKDTVTYKIASGDTVELTVLNIKGNTLELTTQGVGKSFSLSGLDDWYDGATKLHAECKSEYGNEDMGISARSMTIEDLNELCNHTLGENDIYYYYSSDYPEDKIPGNNEESTPKIYHIKHRTDYDASSGWTEPRFYINSNNEDCDGNVITGGELRSDGSRQYRTPTATEPVKVVKTWYWYNPTTDDANVGSILGGTNEFGWLASPCVYSNLNYSYSVFAMRIVSAFSVDSNHLAYSNGGVNSPSSGLRPIVTLSSKLINTAESTQGAWVIKGTN